MNERLKKYFDSLFEGAPDTKEMNELKEEIFRNTLDRYNDLLSQGKSEDASFTQAIARIGDIDELISLCNIGTDRGNYYSKEKLDENSKKRNTILIAACVIYLLSALIPIALYGTSVLLAIIISILGIAAATGLTLYGINLKIDPETFSRFINSKKEDNGKEYSVEDFEKKRKRNNIVLSVGISLFIISPVPILLFSYLHDISQPGVGTVIINGNFFAIITVFLIAAAIGTEMFYKTNKLDIRRFSAATMVEDFKTWNKINQKGNGFIKILDVIVFFGATVIYIIGGIEIESNAWIFLFLDFAIAFVITQIIRQFFELAKLSKK